MKMIDTALESLDVLFFDDKILGTTGVPYIDVMFHLLVRVNMFIQKELVHSFKKLPDTNSYFLEKITSGMVKSNHMKLKKKFVPHTTYSLSVP